MNQGTPRVKQKLIAEDLLHGLEHILSRTERIAFQKKPTCTELDVLADKLAQVRSALADVARISRSGYADQDTIESLLARFLNLEGAVKEMRNDKKSVG